MKTKKIRIIEMKEDLRFLVGCISEWPTRAYFSNIDNEMMCMPSLHKERASFVVRDGLFAVPIYKDDPRFDSARLFGYSEEEFIEAKRIIKMETKHE
jgi:hypothetical protein